MKTVSLNIDITSFWHIGSGHGRGGDVDAVVLRDTAGLPYIPGKTIKGLIREAAQIAEDNQKLAAGTVSAWFGKNTDEKPKSPEIPGKLVFDNAHIEIHDRDVLVNNKDLTAGLFVSIASTKIDSETGVAEDQTLRRKEVVIPLTLQTHIHGPDDTEWVNVLQKALPLVRTLGVNRHRGLGRCSMTIQTEVN
jgi:CRISPR/Cas system CSM-associated protein Csm3 (group 7 of RAMP superfamily)